MSSFLLKIGTLSLHNCDSDLCEARSLNQHNGFELLMYELQEPTKIEN